MQLVALFEIVKIMWSNGQFFTLRNISENAGNAFSYNADQSSHVCKPILWIVGEKISVDLTLFILSEFWANSGLQLFPVHDRLFIYHVDEPVYICMIWDSFTNPISRNIWNCKNKVVKWRIFLNPQYISKLLVTHFHTMPIKGRMYGNSYCELLGKRFQLILLYSFCPNFGQIVGCSCLPCMIEFLYHVDEPVYISLVECPSDVAFSSSVLRMWHLTYGHTHRPDLYM